MTGLAPASPSQISSVAPLASNSLERELAWAAGTLRAFQNRIRRYVEIRSLLDRCLWEGRHEDALELVDRINETVCWSLEMLSARIALTTLVHGLEAQKGWIVANAEGASVAALFYSYWFGVRAEHDQSPGRFLSEIGGHIHRVWTDAAGKRFLTYQLAGRVIEGGDEAEMIVHAQTMSVIDLYETCVQLARVSAAEERPTSELLYRYVLPLMWEVGDRRAFKISYLMGYLPAADQFDAIDFASDAAVLTKKTPTTTLIPNFNQVRFAADIGSVFERGESGGLGGAIKDAQLEPEKLDVAFDRILRHAVLFPRFNVGEYSAAMAQIAGTPSPIENAAAHRRRFMASNEHDPSSLPYLPEPVAEHYSEVLRGVAGCPALVVEYHQFDGKVPNGLTENARIWWELSVAAAARDTAQVVHVLQVARGRELPGTRLATWTEIEALLSDGRINDAVDLVADLYRRDSRLLAWLPLSRIAARLDDSTVGRYSGSTNMALVTWLLAENFDRDFRSSVSYAVERYLDDRGLLRPSELEAAHAESAEELEFLLRAICTEDTLSLSLAYGSRFELDEERLAILAKLKSLSSERLSTYDDEITLILRRQEVTKAIKSLDRSKISMDEEPIRDWARKNLRGKFERFRALIDAGMETVSESYLFEMLDRLESGASDTKLYEIPDNEVSALLAEILDQLCRESSLNSRHGINSYLSLRIRHGTISGQLRRPSQEQHLLTTVSATGDYAANDHWYEALDPIIGHEYAGRVSLALADFSREYDLLVERFSSDFVQIRRAEKPKGLISYRFADGVVLGLSSVAQDIVDFEEFLDDFFKIYWLHLEKVLGSVQDYIRGELRGEFDSLFDVTLQRITDSIGTSSLPVLNDALLRARSGIHDALNEMAEWFDVPQAVESSPLTIDVLVAIGKQMVRRLHPNFDPTVEITGELDLRLSNALTVFTDALFILFGNVAKHADLDTPIVNIEIDSIEAGVLELSFTSDCRDISHHIPAIEEVKSKLKSADFSKDVSGEGGTGFPKLAKIMAFSTAPDPVDIGVDADAGRFSCKLKFSFRLIRQGNEEQDNAHIVG